MISVILPVCHESSAVFRRAVDSILNQTINDIECIIVIDDPCNTAVLEASEQYTRQDGRIVLIRNKTNMGQPYSMNEAIRAAHGEYIARMDADYPSEHRPYHSRCIRNELQFAGIKQSVRDSER